MRKATRPSIILFVVMILVIVPSMSMAAAGAAGGAAEAAASAATGATIFGVSLPIAVLGGGAVLAGGIYLVTQVLVTTTHTIHRLQEEK